MSISRDEAGLARGHSHVPGSFRDSVRGAWKGLNAEKSTPTGPYVFLTAPSPFLFSFFPFSETGLPCVVYTILELANSVDKISLKFRSACLCLPRCVPTLTTVLVPQKGLLLFLGSRKGSQPSWNMSRDLTCLNGGPWLCFGLGLSQGLGRERAVMGTGVFPCLARPPPH